MNRNQTVRRMLQSFVHPHDAILFHGVNHYQQRLLEECPEYEREIDLIIKAINCEVVSEMKRLHHAMPPSILLPKLSRWLMRQTSLGENEASWAVYSWAMALGMIPFIDEELATSVRGDSHE